MVSAIISRLVILLFGTLYPAYASYKAVRTKNVKEYVKWMMYWIVFALFCSIETFSDVFLSWMPFYYELKIIFVLWMLSPMTQGSSFLFKKFVHPQLARREKDIDEMIDQASRQGYSTLMSLGTKGLSYASQVVMKTAIMGQSKLVDHLRRSYSTSDLSDDGQALTQRHRAMDDDLEDEGEDDLDNRIREDNAELDRRQRTKLQRSKSSAGDDTAANEKPSTTNVPSTKTQSSSTTKTVTPSSDTKSTSSGSKKQTTDGTIPTKPTLTISPNTTKAAHSTTSSSKSTNTKQKSITAKSTITSSISSKISNMLHPKARTAKQASKSKKEDSEGLILTSVKEEEGEEDENVITETYSIPASARRHYSMRERKGRSAPASAKSSTRAGILMGD